MPLIILTSQELKQIRKALATSFISGDPLKQNILQEQILLWFVSLRGKYYLYVLWLDFGVSIELV